jgi:hypothetical protein
LKLFHFTPRLWWPIIQHEGIIRGVAPISPDDALDMPNLTSNDDPAAQQWGEPINGVIGWFRKNAVRISLDVSPDDPRLISFDAFALRHGVSPEYCVKLDEEGGFGSKHWYYYDGAITPDRFTAVDFFGGEELSLGEELAVEMIRGARTWAEAASLLGHQRVKGGWPRFVLLAEAIAASTPSEPVVGLMSISEI